MCLLPIYCRLLDPDFRPGPEYYEQITLEDQKRLTAAERAALGAYDQEQTDWSVEAVEDEDDLF